MIVDCIADLPPHHQLHITHNDHKGSYEKLSDYISERLDAQDISDDEKAKCIENDELWTVQLYPISPISFYFGAASTLKAACEVVVRAMKKDGRI